MAENGARGHLDKLLEVIYLMMKCPIGIHQCHT